MKTADLNGGPWYGADGAIVQPHVDGLFYFAVEHEGKIWPHYDRFLDMLPAELGRHTWMCEATRGLETIITITFIAQDDSTMVTLRHEGVPDDERGHGHEAGWTWMLDMLAQRFQAKTPA